MAVQLSKSFVFLDLQPPQDLSSRIISTLDTIQRPLKEDQNAFAVFVQEKLSQVCIQNSYSCKTTAAQFLTLEGDDTQSSQVGFKEGPERVLRGLEVDVADEDIHFERRVSMQRTAAG